MKEELEGNANVQGSFVVRNDWEKTVVFFCFKKYLKNAGTHLKVQENNDHDIKCLKKKSFVSFCALLFTFDKTDPFVCSEK